jgi:HAD superfamily hydrolase (TIGR01509 family)
VSERPWLEAVVFDAGGTLVRLDFEWMAAVAREYGYRVDPETLRRAELMGRRRYDASRATGVGSSPPLGGAGDVRDYFGGMLMAVGIPSSVIGTLVVRYLARERQSGLWSRPNEGARAAIDWVVSKGLRCAVVSNSDGRADWHLRHSGVRSGLEFVVDSHVVGVEKPDPRIFAIALERLGVAPDRALYVGDIRSVDETGARGAGMRFVLLDPEGAYADGAAHVSSIGALPEWIERHFRLSPARESLDTGPIRTERS